MKGKPQMPTKCEVVTVSVTDEAGNVAVAHVPAFTVRPAVLEKRILDLTREYIDRSDADEECVSLGDFALWLIANATDNPDELPDTEPSVSWDDGDNLHSVRHDLRPEARSLRVLEPDDK